MPLYFCCPHCGFKTDLPDQFAGMSGNCSKCGHPIEIPTVGTYYPPKTHRVTTATIIMLIAFLGVALLVAGLLVSLLIPLLSADRDAAKRAVCTGNLKQIGLALQSYEQKYGCFPPAYVPDKNGKPLVSWRVLILPFLGQQDLYDRYRFDEPWDSPNNNKITEVALGIYQCPAQEGLKDPTTNYMMVVGPDTISDGSNARKASDITDGTSNTIAVVEVADSPTWWAEPVDLNFNQIGFTINQGKRQAISSYHSGGVNVGMCDGVSRFLVNGTNPNLVKAMLTINGGEKNSPD